MKLLLNLNVFGRINLSDVFFLLTFSFLSYDSVDEASMPTRANNAL